MGSKTHPKSEPFQVTPHEAGLSSQPLEVVGSKNRLLSCIADALQIPQAALYQPPNALTPAIGADGDVAVDLDRDCAVLLGAFRRIADPKERGRFLVLVRAAAEQV